MNSGVAFEAFVDDLKLMRATERGPETLDEAAHRVSPVFTAKHPQIAWHAMIGQRNILAHEYGPIDYELLYRTVKDDISNLIRQAELLIHDMGGEE